MPNFAWKGRTRAGKLEDGILIADSKDAAAAILRRQQIQVTSLRARDRRIPLLPRLGGRINSSKLSIFTRQFSVMLDAGLPLVQCLEILGGQEEHKIFKAIINAVRTDVESGMSLAEAMKRHPNAFDNLYVNMIAAGEAGGILDIILQRLSVYIEKAVKLKNQVKSALMYPITVLLIAAGVVYIILWKVIPVFAQMFAGMGAQLPYLTRYIVKASYIVGSYGGWILLLLFLLSIATREWHKTYRGRRILDRMQLMIPIIGGLLLKISIARFCRTLATLTSSGVPILDGLEITARTSGNAIVEDSIMSVRKSVEEGKTISAPLQETKVYPMMVCQMISVGEQTGALDQMLSKIADFYEDEVDAAVGGLMKLIEPIMIVILGVIIGVIVVAMYLPMFSLFSKIG
ncbi:MAG: type II secretion system F family protein [bacterium]|nr:type II secretion system F family protein [bacterium]